MPFIDFREIPEAHLSSGAQDTFEMFARDFFVDILNFEIISEPSRGADGGKDILLAEKQLGTLSNTTKIWLVSCKHKAHSGRSINPSDEENITDRIAQHGADGFIGFYSTIPSSGLNVRLDSIANRERQVAVFDSAKIEYHIIMQKRYELFKRYFPASYSRWLEIEGKHLPTKLTSSYQPLSCDVCGTDLLKIKKQENFNHGIIGFVCSDIDGKESYTGCYVACTGDCDRQMSAYHLSQGNITAWESLGDLLIPTYYLQKYMAVLNQVYEQRLELSQEAFEQYKKILISVGQLVFRHQTGEELERAIELSELPSGI